MSMSISPRLGLLLLLPIVVFALAAGIWQSRGSASEGGSSDIAQRPAEQFASRALHYTMVEYTNYEVRGSTLPIEVQTAQTKLITERWVQLDSSGNAIAEKDVTRLSSGVVWQERLDQGGIEVVNWYDYPSSHAKCSQTSPFEGQSGSALPISSKVDLEAAGLTQTDRPSDFAQSGISRDGHSSFEKSELRSPAPGMVSGRAVTIRDNASGMRVADLFYGVLAQGTEVLLQSTTFSAFDVIPIGSAQLFSVANLPAGCGRPS